MSWYYSLCWNRDEDGDFQNHENIVKISNYPIWANAPLPGCETDEFEPEAIDKIEAFCHEMLAVYKYCPEKFADMNNVAYEEVKVKPLPGCSSVRTEFIEREYLADEQIYDDLANIYKLKAKIVQLKRAGITDLKITQG